MIVRPQSLQELITCHKATTKKRDTGLSPAEKDKLINFLLSAQVIDCDKYIKAINSEMLANEAERDGAVKSHWFEKAAKLEVKNEGLKSARFLASSGDYHLRY